jgi:carnosine N-methyltransferase
VLQEVYARPEFRGSFDAVVTCFFIDTAHNILEYLEVIHAVLRPGGLWLHLGPLLWHWAEGSWDELSVELSLSDVQQVAQLMGFEMLQQQFVDAAYIGEGNMCVDVAGSAADCVRGRCGAMHV